MRVRLRSKITLLALLLATNACSPQPESTPSPRVFQGATMGTTYTVKVNPAGHSPAQLDRLQPLIQRHLDDVDAKMSTYREDSELSRFNRFPGTTTFPVSAATFEVFRIARQVSEDSGGAFDVTVGPLVDLWGFGPDGRGDEPEESELERLRARIGYELVELDEGSRGLRKRVPEVAIDLSAIAKGYGVDRVALALVEEGIGSFMVEVGGEIRTLGFNDRGDPWQLAIERPDPNRRAIHRVVPVSDASLATSGDYRNFYLEDGVRISHTIDPRTLSPVNHEQVSASVIHESCAVADAWATALMVLGPDAGHELAEARGIAALLLVASEEGIEERMTSGFRERTGIEE